MVDRSACPCFHAAIELLGRRWNGVIIDNLLAGPLRFSEFRESIPEITPAMLSQRLKELEGAKLVRRDVSATRPIEVRYALTEIGQRISTALDAVAEWSIDWSRAASPENEREEVRWNSASIPSAS
jgi:DNA-binding HxlR family transcriptional regulator